MTTTQYDEGIKTSNINKLEWDVDLLGKLSPNSYVPEKNSHNFQSEFHTFLNSIIQSSDITINLINEIDKLNINSEYNTLHKDNDDNKDQDILKEELKIQQTKNENILNYNIQFREMYIRPIIYAINNVLLTDRSAQQIFQNIFENIKSISSYEKTIKRRLSYSSETKSSVFIALFTILDHIIPLDLETVINSLEILSKITTSDYIIRKMEKFIEESNYSFILRLIEVYNECDGNDIIMHLILKIMYNIISSEMMILISIRDGFIQFLSDTCIPYDSWSFNEEDIKIINFLLDRMLSTNYLKTIEKYGNAGIIKLINKIQYIDSTQVQKKVELLYDSFKQQDRNINRTSTGFRLYA